jgi:hypothetical protein
MLNFASWKIHYLKIVIDFIFRQSYDQKIVALACHTPASFMVFHWPWLKVNGQLSRMSMGLKVAANKVATSFASG